MGNELGINSKPGIKLRSEKVHTPMPHAYTEDQLVEQPAIGLFAEYSARPNPHPQPFSHWEKGGRPAGLRVRSFVVLVSRLRAVLDRLNPALPSEAITAAVDELTRDRSAMSLEAANREVYLLLKEGIRVSVADSEPSPNPLPKGEGVPAQNAPLYLLEKGQGMKVRGVTVADSGPRESA
jgi:hypothetical protein